MLYFWHSVGNRLLTLLSNALTNLNLTDMETCYKAFKRGALQNFVIESDRFGFEPEITAKVAKSPCVVYEVPISYHGRTYAQGKKITWRDGCAAIVHIVQYNLLRRPEQCWKRSVGRNSGARVGAAGGPCAIPIRFVAMRLTKWSSKGTKPAPGAHPRIADHLDEQLQVASRFSSKSRATATSTTCTRDQPIRPGLKSRFFCVPLRALVTRD